MRLQWPISFSKQIDREVQFNVTNENELLRALFKWVTQGFPLSGDDKKALIEAGFMGNANVFGIISKILVLAKEIPVKLYDKQPNGDLEEVTGNEPLLKLLERPNQFQSWRSFIEELYMFYLTTGDAMAYFRPFDSGNDKGKIDKNGLIIMPSQYVKAISGGWKRPIDHYILDMDNEEELYPENVIHIKTPNPEYAGGKQLMGLSPLKVAAKKINMLNASDSFVTKNYQRGLPPGILTMLDKTGDSGKKEKVELDRMWTKKYSSESGSNKGGKPIIGTGNMQWTKMGFDTFRDLMVLEMNQEGARALCTIYGVSSRYFANDTVGVTYNNFREDKAAAYTARIIPDLNDICEEITWRIAKKYKESYVVKIDTSDIDELQENKKDKAVWLGMGVNNRSFSRNEFRIGLGSDAREEEEFDDPNQNSLFYMPPDEPTDDQVDKYLKSIKTNIYDED